MLKDVLGAPLVKHSGPSTLQVGLNKKGTESYVLHLLHYLPLRRSDTVDVIEDVIPLTNIALNVAVPAEVEAVTLVPEGAGLEWRVQNGRVNFTLPDLVGHQMVEIRFKA